MFKQAIVLFLYAETPLHPGTGTSLSLVDLPIQRERISDLPMIQASSLKGALRAEALHILEMRDKSGAKEKIEALFGPETQRASEHAGCVSPHDARLLLFPVRSLVGVFAWTTCPFVLERFKRELTAAGFGKEIQWEVPSVKNDGQALVTEQSELTVDNGTIVLEEFAFKASKNKKAQVIAEWLQANALPEGKEYKPWRNWLLNRLVILPDDAFRDFTKMATEVITRVRLSQKKTVEEGALWTEEHLPSETLLYAPIFIGKPLGEKKKVPNEFKENDNPSAEKVQEWLLNHLFASQQGQPSLSRLQIGGDETVGRGVVALRAWAGSTARPGGKSDAVNRPNP